jgi:hypothetical protein
MKGLIVGAIGVALICPAYAQSPLRLQCRHEPVPEIKPLRKDKTFGTFIATIRLARPAAGAHLLATNKGGPCTSFSLMVSEQNFEGRCAQTVSAGGEPMAFTRILKIDRKTGAFEEMHWIGSSPGLVRSGHCLPRKARLKISR